MRILLDGMGGDYAPVEIVKGAVAAAREAPEKEKIKTQKTIRKRAENH